MPHPSRRSRRLLLPALLALLCSLAAPRAEAAEIAAGMPLTDALLELQARGLKLVWSSAVVRPEMRVVSPPQGDDLRSLLEQLLAPHGLAAEEAPGGSLVVAPASRPAGPALLRGSVRSRRGLAPVAGVSVLLLERGLEATTDREGRFEFARIEPGAYTLEARRPGFIIEQLEAVGVAPGGAVEVDFVLQPAPLSEEEITVHPSRISLLHDQPAAPLALSRAEILTLPHLGGDVFRALSLLPGTASNDVTAQFHVRGGRRDEVLVLLDGQELYEAYHLKDFDNALSVVPASSLAKLDLSTGAFPSSRGDRMGAILDMSSIVPAQPRRFRLSLSVLSAEADGSGAIGERLTWLASARRGTTDLAAGLFGKEENPIFGDLFGKVEYRLGDRQTVRANLLHSTDRLDFVEERAGELRALDTAYDSSYLWATHQAVLTDRLFVDTALSAARVHRDRRGMEDEEEKQFEVRDQRDLEVAGLQQSWNLQAGPRNFLHGGYELRRFEADYDYFSFRDFHSPFVELRAEPRDGVFAFRDAITDDYLGAYVSDQLRPLEALTLELGVRYDRHTLTRDTLWSPRASLAWGLGSSSVVRVGWGHYHQTQRAYERQIEDGDIRFYPAERSEHWIAGFEHVFAPAGGAAAPIAAVRAEVYTRRVSDPRPRYESLFEPFEPLTEGELDRHRLEPDQGEAWGAELFLHGRAGRRLGWWVNYAYAKSHDEIDGHEVPRQIDQRHTLNLDLNYRLGRHWDANLAWRYHTGWPTTPVFLEEGVDEEGEVELVPVLGPLNSGRLPDYHRLDLRLSRRWELGWGRLTAFADVQNLYDRQNVAGFDLDLDEEAGVIVADEETWPGFFASAGVSWEF